MLIIFLIAGSFNPSQFNSASAETGLGANIFKVILTIIGADKAKYRRCSCNSYRK